MSLSEKKKRKLLEDYYEFCDICETTIAGLKQAHAFIPGSNLVHMLAKCWIIAFKGAYKIVKFFKKMLLKKKGIEVD